MHDMKKGIYVITSEHSPFLPSGRIVFMDMATVKMYETYDSYSLIDQIHGNYAAFIGKKVGITGKIVEKRVIGKVTLLYIQDASDLPIIIFICRDDIGEDRYNDIKQLAVNTSISIIGNVSIPKKGKHSIRMTHFTTERNTEGDAKC